MEPCSPGRSNLKYLPGFNGDTSKTNLPKFRTLSLEEPMGMQRGGSVLTAEDDMAIEVDERAFSGHLTEDDVESSKGSNSRASEQDYQNALNASKR